MRVLFAALVAASLAAPAMADEGRSQFTACNAKHSEKARDACTKKVLACSRPVSQKVLDEGGNLGSIAVNSIVHACGGGSVVDL